MGKLVELVRATLAKEETPPPGSCDFCHATDRPTHCLPNIYIRLCEDCADIWRHEGNMELYEAVRLLRIEEEKRMTDETSGVAGKCPACRTTGVLLLPFGGSHYCASCIRAMRDGSYKHTGVSIVDAETKAAVRETVWGRTPAELIADSCDEIKAMLLKKNESYGNSALNPTRIFSRATVVQGLCTRIDDKLSRLMRGNTAAYSENDVDDLIGYLVLLRIAKKHEDGSKS